MSILLTKLGIWQKASMKVGGQRIIATDLTAPSSSSNQIAQYLTDVWPFELAGFLEEHPWSFATETVPLIPLNPPQWLANTAYTVGNYVLQGGFIYVCVVAYTSTSVFANDLSNGYWQICYATNVPQNPPTWMTGIPYVLGSTVYYNGAIYTCQVVNTSSASFANDLAAGYWSLVYTGTLAPAAWVTGTFYDIGTFVTQGGQIYMCIIPNTAGTFATDLSNGYWSIQLPISPLIKALPIMNDGCNNPYALPSDFVSAYKFGAPAFYRKETVGAPYLPVPTEIMMCNNSNIPTMKYVSAYPAIALFSAKACDALSTRLAKQLAMKVTDGIQYLAGLIKEYDTDIINAIASDSNSTSPDEAIADAWFWARLAGNTGAVGVGQDNDNVGWGIPGIGL